LTVKLAALPKKPAINPQGRSPEWYVLIPQGAGCLQFVTYEIDRLPLLFPVPFNEHPSAIMGFPAWGNPDKTFVRRLFPVTRRPDIGMTIVPPVTSDPDMAG
jgi:hypothetical protein